MHFNGHRLQYNRSFQLILISRMKQPNFPKEFMSLCIYVNISPNNYDIKTELTWLILSSLKPQVVIEYQKLYYQLFTCIRYKVGIDQVVMNKIKQDASLQSIWTDTDSILDLNFQRERVRYLYLLRFKWPDLVESFFF